MALLRAAGKVPLLSMNMLLFFLLVAAGEAAYITTSIQQQSADGFQEQEAAWQSEDDSLTVENRQLLNAKEDLVRNITSTETTVNDLTTQLNRQKASGAPPVVAAQTPAPSTQATEQPAITPTTSLGTLSTIDGKKYENCQMLKIEADGVVISHSEGITKVLYANMPPDVQVRFEVDPATGTASPAAQAKYQNLIEQGAGGAH